MIYACGPYQEPINPLLQERPALNDAKVYDQIRNQPSTSLVIPKPTRPAPPPVSKEDDDTSADLVVNQDEIDALLDEDPIVLPKPMAEDDTPPEARPYVDGQPLSAQPGTNLYEFGVSRMATPADVDRVNALLDNFLAIRDRSLSINSRMVWLLVDNSSPLTAREVADFLNNGGYQASIIVGR